MGTLTRRDLEPGIVNTRRGEGQQTDPAEPHQQQDSGPVPRRASRKPRRAPRNWWQRMPSGFSTLRDLLTFLIGMGIVVNEVFLSPAPDPTAVGIGAALTGLPLVFGADERGKKS